MRVLISAAEASSDIHAAHLLAALKKIDPEIEAFGVGGPALQAQSLETVVDARELLAMGFVEILGKLPKVFSSLKKLVRAAKSKPVDLAVLVDYPDFHFRLAARLAHLGIPLVYYIPPKVWAWRKRRIKFLKERFAKILCILPFEQEFYRRESVDALYVGNPLLDELPLDMTRTESRRLLKIEEDALAIVLMPGSRKSEIARHFDLMLDATLAAAKEFRKEGRLKEGQRLIVLLPAPATTDFSKIEARSIQWQHSVGEEAEYLEIRVSQGDAAYCLAAADAGLIKSGTSTLEAGLMRCPHAVIYKPSRSTAWIFKNLIRYKGPVGLVNLAGGWSPGDPFLVPEILCEKVTVSVLKDLILDLVKNPETRNAMVRGFESLRRKMRQSESPSTLAAREIYKFLSQKKNQPSRSEVKL
ncbi:MAG: lipid-A-disaccharide synthase [Bdellovibrio sp.]|nr:lipid-A-disaccharide synthase [Bdellovibrio sp.]